MFYELLNGKLERISNIGGYCGGGCQLSHGVDFTRCCEYEKKTFAYFIDETFRPYVKKLYEEITDINEK